MIVRRFDSIHLDVGAQHLGRLVVESDRTPTTDAIFQRSSGVRPVSEVDEGNADLLTKRLERLFRHLRVVANPGKVVLSQKDVSEIEGAKATEPTAGVPRQREQRVFAGTVAVGIELAEDRLRPLGVQHLVIDARLHVERRHVDSGHHVFGDRVHLLAESEEQFERPETVVQRRDGEIIRPTLVVEAEHVALGQIVQVRDALLVAPPDELLQPVAVALDGFVGLRRLLAFEPHLHRVVRSEGIEIVAHFQSLQIRSVFV